MPYAAAFAAGLLAGVLYGVIGVRSPAPPIIALVGLLGILAGEQIPPLVRRIAGGDGLTVATVKDVCSRHVFGALPTRPEPDRRTGPDTPPRGDCRS